MLLARSYPTLKVDVQCIILYLVFNSLVAYDETKLTDKILCLTQDCIVYMHTFETQPIASPIRFKSQHTYLSTGSQTLMHSIT